jgi:Ca2+/Na+ antiporter
MNNLLTLSFWFNLRPPSMLPFFNYTFIAILILFLILSVLAFYFKKRKKIYKSFWLKFYDFSASNLIIGLFLWFFNWQEVPFLSARFWLILWALLIIVWLIFIYKHLKKIPINLQKIEEQQKFNQYIPK